MSQADAIFLGIVGQQLEPYQEIKFWVSEFGNFKIFFSRLFIILRVENKDILKKLGG